MIPKPIYEVLPYVYIVLGILTVIYFHGTLASTLGALSGIIFILTGMLVIWMRYDDRRYQYTPWDKK